MLGSLAIGHIGFFVSGGAADVASVARLEETLALFVRAEQLGYDSAWVRMRRMGEAAAENFVAAALQRTRRLALGVSVSSPDREDALRLVEDLGSVDMLRNERLHVDLGSGSGPAPAPEGRGRAGGCRHGAAARPDVDCLRGRLWYGAGSLRSAAWAGVSGFNLLVGSTVSADRARDFHAAQLAQIEAYWNGYAGKAPSRVSVGRIILPFDGAGARTRKKYMECAERVPQAGRQLSFAPAVIGTAEQIIETLTRDPVLRHTTELRLQLPCGLGLDDHEQVLSDFIRLIGPEIGHGRLH